MGDTEETKAMGEVNRLLRYASMYLNRQEAEEGRRKKHMSNVAEILGEIVQSAKKRKMNITVKQCEHMEITGLYSGRKKRLIIEFSGPPEPDVTDCAVQAIANLFGEREAS